MASARRVGFDPSLMRLGFPGRWRRKVVIAIAAVVLAGLLFLLLAWLALPPLLKWQAETRLSALLGRDVLIEKVAFNPWRLDLAVTNLRVGAAPGMDAASSEAPLLTVGRVHVDFAASSLLQAAPVIEALTVDTVRLRLARLSPGHYDIDDILRRWSTPSSSTPTRPAELRFALYNAQLHNAAVRFDDRPFGRVHDLAALDLALPFLSNLPTQLDVQIAPRLAFMLNGVPFGSSGLATPFSLTRAGVLKLAVRSLDVAPYLGYLPASLPVKIVSGLLSTDLTLDFAAPATGTPVLRIGGTVALQNARIVQPEGKALVSWRRADLNIRSIEPFSRRAALASVRVEGVDAQVRRAADGTIDLPGLGRPDGALQSAVPSTSDPASRRAQSPPAPPEPWKVEIERIDATDSAVASDDASVHPVAAIRLSGLTVGADHVAWPLRRPIDVVARGLVELPGSSGADAGRVEIGGSVSPAAIRLHTALERLPLAAFEGYFATVLTPRVDGSAAADARIDWTPDRGMRVALDTATVDALALRVAEARPSAPGGVPGPASITRLSLGGVEFDAAARSVKIGSLAIEEPALALSRGADGLIDARRWLVVPPVAAAAAAAVSSASAPSPRPWRVDVAAASVTGGRLQWTDASAPGRGADDPVRLTIADLRVDLQAWAWQADLPVVPAHFKASGRAGSPPAPGEPASRIPGTFDWRGVVGMAPLEIIGSLKTERLPLHLLTPYFGDGLPVRFARVELGIDGQLSMRKLSTGLDVDAGADVLLGAVRIETAPKAAHAAAGDTTLVSWNTLGLKGVQVAVKAGAKPRVDVAEAALTDLYSRLVITEDGRLNVSSLGGAAASVPRQPPPARPAAPASLPIDLRIGATALANGRIDFSDHFVRPNYSAALTELGGRLGALDSVRPAMAPLSLRGKAAGTAQLEIDGSVDPFGTPPALDLRAKATDLELAPLSPYAGKYAGYGIERGKLSVDVAYRLGADGRLDATNRVVLNQLTFGDRVESPTATSLPVLLAVSLLKDRNGVIDLELPIRGSVNDPQFSVAAIIGRLLGNLLVKAITSPFSLLARGAGGGGDPGGDPGRVEFVPGTARLTAAGAAAVDTVAQALVGKPGLLLTVTGTADAAREQEAYRSAVLDERIDAGRRKASVASAAAASAPLPVLSADERMRLLRQIYRESDLPGKPRNALGFATDVPVAEMETRLKAAIELDADTVRALALQRGVGVRDALVAKGLSSDRLFLAAPRVDDASIAEPEARLALTLR